MFSDPCFFSVPKRKGGQHPLSSQRSTLSAYNTFRIYETVPVVAFRSFLSDMNASMAENKKQMPSKPS
jgi:hypothetical protein